MSNQTSNLFVVCNQSVKRRVKFLFCTTAPVLCELNRIGNGFKTSFLFLLSWSQTFIISTVESQGSYPITRRWKVKCTSENTQDFVCKNKLLMQVCKVLVLSLFVMTRQSVIDAVEIGLSVWTCSVILFPNGCDETSQCFASCTNRKSEDHWIREWGALSEGVTGNFFSFPSRLGYYPFTHSQNETEMPLPVVHVGELHVHTVPR